jgi:hypothetical protein
VIGYDLAAMKIIGRVANDRKQNYVPVDAVVKDVWAGMGLGSDLAAVLDGRPNKKKR